MNLVLVIIAPCYSDSGCAQTPPDDRDLQPELVGRGVLALQSHGPDPAGRQDGDQGVDPR